MSEYDRHFSHRLITWKLTEVRRESLRESRYSPEFSLSLGDKKTKWHLFVKACKKDKHLGLYLCKNHSIRTDFSISFVAVIRSADQSNEYSGSFNEKCNEVFENTSDGYGFNLIEFSDLFDEDSGFLVANTMTIEIELKLFEDAKICMLPENFLSKTNEKLINNKQYSDFVFICSDGGKIHVQKAYIAVHCEAFATMIAAGMTETETNSATITDIDSETMLELVRFLYCGQVKNMKEVEDRLVIAANKYGLTLLQKLCVSSMMETLDNDDVMEVFKIADLVGEENLKEYCVDHIKAHLSTFGFEGGDITTKQLSRELLCAVSESYDLRPIRLRFENDEFV